ncbi:hypothetical protein C5167_040054 [Papaver somniferum]|uniref:Uncharacterized protein n=1 Tax=Papaver somniferum TaxID=3469 RepID=A0A4Y7IE16_PAPSO|nr:hypothetical protein C5167_040054 [Papaver somniferum]
MASAKVSFFLGFIIASLLLLSMSLESLDAISHPCSGHEGLVPAENGVSCGESGMYTVSSDFAHKEVACDPACWPDCACK